MTPAWAFSYVAGALTGLFALPLGWAISTPAGWAVTAALVESGGRP